MPRQTPILLVLALLGSGICLAAESATRETRLAYRVEFAGNERVSSFSLRKAVRRPEFEEYRVYLVDDLVAAVEDVYSTRGFAEARVRGTDEAADGRRAIRLEIDEGARYRVERVETKGNEVFSAEQLAAYLGQYPGRGRPPFVARQVDRDRRRLEDFYASQGYLDVKVSGTEILDASRGAAAIVHEIDEGRQYTLREVRFAGNTVYSATYLAEFAGLVVGRLYDPAAAGLARIGITDLYRDHGYPEAAVERSEERDDRQAEVRLAFTVVEGPLVRVGAVRLAGNRRTRPHVILNEVDLKEGSLLSMAQLRENRRRVFALGLFRSVRVEPATGAPFDATSDVVIDVEEAPPGWLRLSVGYNTLTEERIAVDTGYGNLFGRRHEIGLRAELTGTGDADELYYMIPRVFGSQFDSYSRLYRLVREEPDFTDERNAVGFELRRRYGRRWQLRLRYGLEDLNLRDVDIDRDELDPARHEGQLSKAGFSLTFDDRDDLIVPHDGSVSRLDLDLGGGALGGDFELVKAQLGTAWYFPLTQRITLSARLRGGWIETYGQTDDSPLGERFLAGGDGSLRGFRRSRVGPTDKSGHFTGGDALLLSTLELEFPLYKKIYGAFFLDAGNVWPDIGDVDLGETRESAGAGIRYRSPVGTLHLDYGHVLDRRDGEDSGRIHFGVGYAF